MPLDRIFSDYRYLSVLRDEIARLESAVELCSPTLDHQPSGQDAPPTDTLERRLIRLMEQKALYARDLLDFEDMLCTLPGRYKQIIRLRYLEGLPWAQVSAQTNYSVSRCHHVAAAIKKAVLEGV